MILFTSCLRVGVAQIAKPAAILFWPKFNATICDYLTQTVEEESSRIENHFSSYRSILTTLLVLILPLCDLIH